MTKTTKLKNIVTFILTTIFVCCNTTVSISQNKAPENIQFWELPTGSKIAFYYFKGKEPRKNTPIIYLHGGPGAHVTSYDTVAFGKLANYGYDIYLYDQIGSGQSERLNNIMDYTVERHLKDLEAIVNIIGATKIVLIGHSWGASLAPLYIARHPDKVEKIILSGPGGIIPKNFDNKIPVPDSIKLKRKEIVKYSMSDYLDSKSVKRYNKICTEANKGVKIASDNEIDSLLDCLMMNKSNKNNYDSLKKINFERGSGGYSNYMTGKYLYTGMDIRDTLSKCKVPVLILLGEYDDLPWACVNDYLKVFKNTKLVIIPNSGHSVFTYQPDLCLKLSREFLNSIEK